MDELLADSGGDCLYCVFIQSSVPQPRSFLWIRVMVPAGCAAAVAELGVCSRAYCIWGTSLSPQQKPLVCFALLFPS